MNKTITNREYLYCESSCAQNAKSGGNEPAPLKLQGGMGFIYCVPAQRIGSLHENIESRLLDYCDSRSQGRNLAVQSAARSAFKFPLRFAASMAACEMVNAGL
jgi:hypothetical protein